jgi:hypothetical protein
LHLRQATWLLLALGGLLLVVAPLAIAQSADEGPFTLAWWTVDAGGTTYSAGGGYTLGGTAGQPDAGLLNGGGYTLGGGFWRGGALAPPEYQLYLPLVLRNG